MKLETLKDRISKAEEKITKKTGTIEKKTALIAKKTASLERLTGTERRWMESDIEDLHDDIKRLESEIKETEKSLENYRAQMSGAVARENLLTKELPETLRTLKTELVTEWNRYDINRRESMKAYREENGRREFLKKYGYSGIEFMAKTDEEINKANERDAESIILNLVNRVKGYTGEITNWSGLTLDEDNNGWSILNGYVEGKEGRCVVESIGAGGYNIQRYHIRVLVKPIN